MFFVKFSISGIVYFGFFNRFIILKKVLSIFCFIIFDCIECDLSSGWGGGEWEWVVVWMKGVVNFYVMFISKKERM